MAGQGFVPNDPESLRGRDGPGGPDAPESLQDARDVIRGKKTVEQAVAGSQRLQRAPETQRDDGDEQLKRRRGDR